MKPLTKYFIEALVYSSVYTAIPFEIVLPDMKARAQTSSILLAQTATIHTSLRLETSGHSYPSSAERNIADILIDFTWMKN
jgi:hypothetical protein